jgi:glycosyltransferase involved in cell wall biosynthesis
MKLSVVVPVFEEEENLPQFLAKVKPILAALTPDYELIFCMDPGNDQTEALIFSARESDDRVRLLKFSRRFGQPFAILAGLQYSSGDAVAVMDVDLQDPPELLEKMMARMQQGWDVVYAQRRRRDGETWIKKLVSSTGYAVIDKIAEIQIPRDVGEFRLMSRRVVDEVNKLKECHGFLRGLVSFVGFRQTAVVFDRPARHAGTTRYNRFFGSLRVGFNGIFCFSNYALTLSTVAGFTAAAGAFALAALAFTLKLAGFPFPMGDATIIILILFLGGVQLLTVGILGEYIGRIYEETKERPKFIVDKAVGFSD